VDSASGMITVSKLKKVGTNQIEIIGIIPDQTTRVSSAFTIEIKQKTKKRINS
jgi:hypothetical protein